MKRKLFVILLLCLPAVQHSFAAATFDKSRQDKEVRWISNVKGCQSFVSIDSLIKSADVVVIDFWFTGCAPCRKSFPDLEEIYHEFYTPKVKFYGVTAYDDEAAIISFKSKVDVPYPLLQVAPEAPQQYYITEYPTLIIFYKGKPALTLEGYSSLFKSQVKTKLALLTK